MAPASPRPSSPPTSTPPPPAKRARPATPPQPPEASRPGPASVPALIQASTAAAVPTTGLAPTPAPAPAAEPTASLQAALAHARSKSALLVNPLQLRNPLLPHIRHVRTETHTALPSDFQPGPTTHVLYLSLQYHTLHPAYIHTRLRGLPQSRLRILLLHADIPSNRATQHGLQRLALLQKLTLLCAGSHREAARWLETLRAYDTKGAEAIQERVGASYASRLNAALSSVRGVNKTDVSTLAFTFGAFRNLAAVSPTEFRACAGIGERKVSRLYAALQMPFRTGVAWEEGAGVSEEEEADGEGEGAGGVGAMA